MPHPDFHFDEFQKRDYWAETKTVLGGLILVGIITLASIYTAGRVIYEAAKP